MSSNEVLKKVCSSFSEFFKANIRVSYKNLKI